jgi:hypothetical protein
MINPSCKRSSRRKLLLVTRYRTLCILSKSTIWPSAGWRSTT